MAATRWETRSLAVESVTGLTVDDAGAPWMFSAGVLQRSGPRVPLAVQPFSGSFSPVPDSDARSGDLASDIPGRAIVAWSGRPEAGGAVSVATYGTAGWAPHTELDRISGNVDPQIDVAARRARSVVVWRSSVDGGRLVARASWRDGLDGAWSPVSTLGDGDGAPLVGVDAAGNAIATWGARSAGTEAVFVSLLGAGAQAWSAPERVFARSARNHVLTVGAAGDVVVAAVFVGQPGVEAATGRLPGGLGAARLLSRRGDRVSAAVGPNGDATIVVADSRGLAAAARSRRGPFARLTTIAKTPRYHPITGARLDAVVGVDRAGETTVLWVQDVYSWETEYGGTALMARRHPRRGPWARTSRAYQVVQGCGNCSPSVGAPTLASNSAGAAAATVEWSDPDVDPEGGGSPVPFVVLGRLAK